MLHIRNLLVSIIYGTYSVLLFKELDQFKSLTTYLSQDRDDNKTLRLVHSSLCLFNMI